MKKKRIGTFFSAHYLPKISLKMRITYIFLIVIMFQVQAEVYSQNKILSIDMENETLGSVFHQIEELTGFNFLYNNKHINLDRKVSVVAKEQRIEKILYSLFRNTNVEYLILDRQIILKLKKEPSASITTVDTNKAIPKEAVQRKITGKVTDNNGIPLIGVTVLIKGTQRGVATDFDGNYEINAAQGDVLVFSSIGFITYEIPINEDDVYNIEMTSTSLELQAVELVNTGYQKLPKERATGSFGNLNKSVLDKKASVDAVSMLRGEIAGVQFNPNDDANPVIIRGISTINSNRNPLIVVDGFPIQGGLNTINPIDIESISVLKDAAAASIWGIRATNGVIVVVTKKAKRNSKTKVDVSVVSFYTPRPDLKDNYLASPSTQLDYSRAYFNNGLSFLSTTFDPNVDTFIGANTAQITPLAIVLNQQANGQINAEQANAQIEQLKTRDIRDEYSRLLLRPQLRTQYNLVASGGSEKSDYRISLLYNRNDGQYLNESSDQILTNIGNNIQFGKKLRLRTNINASFDRSKLLPSVATSSIANFAQGSTFDYTNAEGFIRSYPFSGSILNPDGSYVAMLGGSNDLASQFLVDRGFEPFTYNLKQEFDNNNNTSKAVDLRLQTALTYDITEGFSIEGMYQLESTWGRGENIVNRNRYESRAAYNYYAQTTSNDDLDNFAIESEPIRKGSIASFSENNLTAHTLRLQMDFDRSYNDGLHKINALAGYEVRKTIAEIRETVRYGYNEQALTFINPNYTEQYDIPLYFSGYREAISDDSRYVFNENRFLSYYANAAYTYANKYTVTGSTRLDDTNLFGQSDEYRNVPLYSAGFKWSVHNEGFFNSESINNLALRFTYGTNGNVNLQTSPFLRLGLSNSQNEDFPNVPYGYVNTVPNPTLRLEKTRTINFGLDFTLFDGLISSTIEYYHKNSEDLLVSQLLNSTVGVTESLLNIGELKNEGVDVSLNLNLINNENLKYSSRFNFSYNNNKVTKLNNDSGTNIGGLIDGAVPLVDKPLFSIHSFNYAGLDSRGYAQFFDQNNNIVDYRTEITSPDALISEGTLIAPYYGSWMNNINYKGWNLRTLVSFQAGHVFRFTDVYNPGGENEVTTFRDFERRWQQPGDENSTDIPALITDFDDKFSPAYNSGFGATSQYLNSDKFVDTATNIVFQEVILSYSFDEKALSKIGLNNFTVSLQGNNLNVWNFNKWDVDPNNSLIPLLPTYSLGLRASF